MNGGKFKGDGVPNHCATGPNELIHFGLVLVIILVDEVRGGERKRRGLRLGLAGAGNVLAGY